MEKCEWKDGKLNKCEEFQNCINAASLSEKGADSLAGALVKGFDIVVVQKPDYCPWCGADIRKPEPEAIIKKSGGTWVARYGGVDYLWTNATPMPESWAYCKDGTEFEKNVNWEPISEIEITDEIVKLNPAVKVEYMGRLSTTLIAIGHGQIVVFDSHNNCYSVKRMSDYDGLATVEDLEK